MKNWQHPRDLFLKKTNQMGLKEALVGADVCVFTESIQPKIVQAISFKNGTLHLSVQRENLMQFKMIEGKIFTEVQAYCKQQLLPALEKIRLTIVE